MMINTQTFVSKINLIEIHSFISIYGSIIDAMEYFWNFCYLQSTFRQPVQLSMDFYVISLKSGKTILRRFTEV